MVGTNGRNPLQEDGVTEGCEEDEDDKESRVSCHKEDIGDFDKSCFSVMEWVEMGLELFIQVNVGEVRIFFNFFFEGF